MKILLNHIGYESGGEKTAIAACSDGEVLTDDAKFMLLENGKSVFEGRPGRRTTVDGWKNRFFYRLDFSDFAESGAYILLIVDGWPRAESPVFSIADALVADRCVSDILFYFKSQRCSWKWNAADACIPFFGGREGRVDVAGGWYDASGDYSKYLSHLSYANYMNPQQTPFVVWALLKLKDGLAGKTETVGQLLEERALEEGLWGADFLVRMQDPEGFFYTTVFDGWSKDPGRRIIAAFRGKEGVLSDHWRAGYRQGGGMAVAALAKAARYRSSGDFGPDDYLAAAVRGWEHLEQHSVEYLDNGRENIIDSYCALTAAVELYQSTGEERFVRAAEGRAGELSELYDGAASCWMVEKGSDRPFFHASDAGFPITALMEFCSLKGAKPAVVAATSELVRTAATDLVELAGSFDDNPFQLARQRVRSTKGDERVSFFIPHDNESGYWWQGENARLASIAYSVRRARRFFPDNADALNLSLGNFADAQLHWVLGRNPYDICMLQGHGWNNPRYEDFFPNAPGGICNGITAGYFDEADIDFLPEAALDAGDNRWRWSEQWIPHAAWFLLAAIE